MSHTMSHTVIQHGEPLYRRAKAVILTGREVMHP